MCQSNGGGAVAVNFCGRSNWNVEVSEEMLNLKCFYNGRGKGTILNFSRRASYSCLFLEALSDEHRTKAETVESG